MSVRVIAVDLDGVLCEGLYWGKGEPKPITKNIEAVNQLALKYFIVIHTARRYEWAEHTLKWLKRNGVNYHAIHFEKMPSDIYVDDRITSFNNLQALIAKYATS